MVNKNFYYFFYGGIFSISFFIILLFLLYITINLSKKSDVFTQTDNIIISVGFSDKSTNQIRVANSKGIMTPTVKTKESSINDIFNSINAEKIEYSKNIVVKKKEIKVDPKFLKKIQSRKKIKQDNKKIATNGELEELNLEYNDAKFINKSKEKSGGIKDEYKAKVFTLLYLGWHHESELFRQVKINIHISRVGKMSYKILQISGDKVFDTTVQAHLEYLLDTIFPMPLEGRSLNFDVYFKSIKGT